ncbi:MAG: pyruvate dehydrogenase complex dihydrolipoamide acetyltransferase [Sediminibacterium sp.]|nr:pyruvate dehydrogenase complex dihydrolipoamide acetyltransferase [Sediminibacterium sp.]
MAEIIKMPRLSDTMTEGVIASWNKNVGDKIAKGDLLAEIETDKAVQELESYQNGYLLFRGADKGQKIAVNDLLCIIGEQGEDVSVLLSGFNSNGTSPVTNATPVLEKPNTVASPALVSPNEMTPNFDPEKHPELILMPRLSDTMTEGVISKWHKNVGDMVSKGDILAEIETDKATMDLESYKNGTLLYQGAPNGSKIDVNELLCVIASEGFDFKSLINQFNLAKHQTPNTASIPEEKAPQVAPPAPPAIPQPPPAPSNIPQPLPQSSAPQNQSERIFASPLAKRIAGNNNINLNQISGSGDHGRIVKQDVEKLIQQKPTSSFMAQPNAVTAQPLTTVSSGIPYIDTPVSQMRRIIAQRLSESKSTSPHFYLTIKVNMDALIIARNQINAQPNTKISFNDFIVKASALALKQHPTVNSSWRGDFIRQNNEIHIGIAIAVDEGLLVPVVRNTNLLSLKAIGDQIRDYAKKAKDRKLQPKDWEGNTFTISNLGMYGIEEFTAIINPPDACILAVGAINQEAVVVQNQIQVGNVMKLTLSCDHRVVDGASGAAFLQTLKNYLEQPFLMLI